MIVNQGLCFSPYTGYVSVGKKNNRQLKHCSAATKQNQLKVPVNALTPFL